ncbi:hypothetical protein [Lutispora sp.]|uniref:hypothetical protein n=1 Tax=Lutispora sp. TaxID=2828727 RepID=UPI003562D285
MPKKKRIFLSLVLLVIAALSVAYFFYINELPKQLMLDAQKMNEYKNLILRSFNDILQSRFIAATIIYISIITILLIVTVMMVRNWKQV